MLYLFIAYQKQNKKTKLLNVVNAHQILISDIKHKMLKVIENREINKHKCANLSINKCIYHIFINKYIYSS